MTLALLLAALVAEPPPAEPPAQALKQVVVDAIRNCGTGHGGDIVVCSRDRGIAEGYRLPKLDPRYAEAQPVLGGAVVLDGVGASGPGQCVSGADGDFTGCAQREYQDWATWKREQIRRRQQQADPQR